MAPAISTPVPETFLTPPNTHACFSKNRQREQERPNRQAGVQGWGPRGRGLPTLPAPWQEVLLITPRRLACGAAAGSL